MNLHVEILKAARKLIAAKKQTYVCYAIWETVGKLRLRHPQLAADLMLAGFTLKRHIDVVLEDKPTLEWLNMSRRRLTDLESEFFRYARLKMIDMLIELYEEEDDGYTA